MFADTAAVRQFDYIVEAVKRAGPRKLLFGSDGPWLHPGVKIAKIRLLGLSAENEALILGGNISRLLHAGGADVTRISPDALRKATRRADDHPQIAGQG